MPAKVLNWNLTAKDYKKHGRDGRDGREERRRRRKERRREIYQKPLSIPEVLLLGITAIVSGIRKRRLLQAILLLALVYALHRLVNPLGRIVKWNSQRRYEAEAGRTPL
ncbi:hypothetical protein BDV96DRAFT_599770 [Lophiotrema nucula]|uniref:Uncharacterized protein n=1 Tax=Lophiotrema nucula TaxID=690887 RepID=A0A6A5ZAH9_9PLEO|nr:hypothetical protein BDV96DRAFT_599770 [Lophiotrema nucula]